MSLGISLFRNIIGRVIPVQVSGSSVESLSSHSFPPFCAVELMTLLRVRVPSFVQFSHCFHSPHWQSTEMEEEDEIFMNLITHCSVLVRIINKCTGKCWLWCQANGGYCSNNYKYKQETQEWWKQDVFFRFNFWWPRLLLLLQPCRWSFYTLPSVRTWYCSKQTLKLRNKELFETHHVRFSIPLGLSWTF